jgi:hypothetical protein
MVRLILDRNGFEAAWGYKTPPEEKDYPKTFPCIVETIDRQGEMHFLSWTDHEITPIPEGSDPEAFFDGYVASSKVDRDYR